MVSRFTWHGLKQGLLHCLLFVGHFLNMGLQQRGNLSCRWQRQWRCLQISIHCPFSVSSSALLLGDGRIFPGQHRTIALGRCERTEPTTIPEAPPLQTKTSSQQGSKKHFMLPWAPLGLAVESVCPTGRFGLAGSSSSSFLGVHLKVWTDLLRPAQCFRLLQQHKPGRAAAMAGWDELTHFWGRQAVLGDWQTDWQTDWQPEGWAAWLTAQQTGMLGKPPQSKQLPEELSVQPLVSLQPHKAIWQPKDQLS